MDNVVKPMAVSYWLSHFQGYQVRHHIYQVKTLKNKIIHHTKQTPNINTQA